MGAKHSAEMKEAPRLHEAGLNAHRAARQAGVLPSSFYRLLGKLKEANPELRLCHGQRPWYEVEPQYEGDIVSELWTYLQCPNCRAKTQAFQNPSDAVAQWNAGNVATVLSVDPPSAAPAPPEKQP
jgi:hypothetical protein